MKVKVIATEQELRWIFLNNVINTGDVIDVYEDKYDTNYLFKAKHWDSDDVMEWGIPKNYVELID